MMATFRTFLFILGLAIAAIGASPAANESNPATLGPTPVLAKTCIITSNLKRLVDFYEFALRMKAETSGEDYAEFTANGGALAIFSANAQERYIPGAAESAKNRSVILEFRVADVDQEYQRLQSLVKTWVKPPTTQRWGTRSIYFRDPDGNLVDFFTPAKPR
jgi:uncharacterized glyoxalase superfamily protein PhnB